MEMSLLIERKESSFHLISLNNLIERKELFFHLISLNNFLADSVAWHSIVTSAAEVHPPIVGILRVNSKTVLVAILVWFSLTPVIVGPRCSRHPSPNTLLVQVNASNPPGVLQVSTVGDGQVGVYLGCLLFAERLGQVASLQIAASQSIKPVHPIVEVASALVVVLDEHVAFSRSLHSWKPTIVGVTARSCARVSCCNRSRWSSPGSCGQ